MLGVFFALVGFVIVSMSENCDDHIEYFYVNMEFYSDPNCTGDSESLDYSEDSDSDPSCQEWEEPSLSVRGVYCEDNIEIYEGEECSEENLIFEGGIIGCHGPISSSSLSDFYLECSDFSDDEDGDCDTALCFSVESVLEKDDGSLVPLKDIEVNDIVKTLNEKNEIVETPVLDVHIHEPIPKGGRISNLRKLFFEIVPNLDDEEEEKKKKTLETGILHITTNHFLYSHPNIVSVESMASKENLKLAGEVKIGDHVIVKSDDDTQKPSIAKITRITIDKDTLQLGTLYTSQGRYFVDGVLVSDYSVSGKSKIVDAVEVVLQKNFYRFWEIVSFCSGGVIDGVFAKEFTLKFVDNIYHPLLGYFF